MLIGFDISNSSSVSKHLVYKNGKRFMFLETLLDAGVPLELAGKCAEVLKRENATGILDRTEEELSWFYEANKYIHDSELLDSQTIDQQTGEQYPS